jgi:hypothetical protein
MLQGLQDQGDVKMPSWLPRNDAGDAIDDKDGKRIEGASIVK